MTSYKCEFEAPLVEGWEEFLEFKPCGRPATKFLHVVKILGAGHAGLINKELSESLATCDECLRARLEAKDRMFLYREVGEEYYRRYLVRDVLES